jgi:stearoyl-CoA desaturase (delta-9 desaturase)
VLSFPPGEAWHNNHHAAPRSSRFGEQWWQIDLGYCVIRTMGLLGWAWNIRVADGAGYRVICPRS